VPKSKLPPSIAQFVVTKVAAHGVGTLTVVVGHAETLAIANEKIRADRHSGAAGVSFLIDDVRERR
jgi:hypothetical protein